jgi:hypothetical protein
MKRIICERCRECSGENCICCEVYLEDRENQRHPVDTENDLDNLATAFLASHGIHDDDSQPTEQPLTDYENDTPLGQQYGDGFDNE